MRKVGKIFFVTLVVFLCFLGGVFWYASTYITGDQLKTQVEQFVTARTGYSLHIRGGITFSAFPFFSLKAQDVHLGDGKNLPLFVAQSCRAELELLPLLERRIVVHSIAIQSPALSLHINGNGIANWEPFLALVSQQAHSVDAPSPESLSQINDAFKISKISLEDGQISFRDMRSGAGWQGSRMSFSVVRNDGWQYAGSLLTEGTGIAKPFGVTTVGILSWKQGGAPSARGNFSSAGAVSIAGESVPVSLRTKYVYTPDVADIVLSDYSLGVADATLSGSLHGSNITSSDWEIDGDIQFSDVSLPFWFGFTEDLPDSLNYALDSLHGGGALRLTQRGVWLDGASVRLLGKTFFGKAYVNDFTHPVVSVDVEGENVNIDDIFPEIMVTPPRTIPRSRFSHPLLRYSEDLATETVTAEDTEWGYDIRIRAQKGHARTLDFGGVSFRCWPAEDGSTNTSYDIEKFYGGSIQSVLNIQDEFSLQATVQDVEADSPVFLLFDAPLLGGTLSGKVDVAATADTVIGMAAGLHGKISASLTNGFVRTHGKKHVLVRNNFSQLSLTLSGKGLFENPEKQKSEPYWPYWWDLQLAADIAEEPDTFSLQLSGPVTIQKATALPVRADDATLQLTWSGDAPIFEKRVTTHASIQGRVSCDLEKEELALDDAHILFPGGSVEGLVFGKALYGDTVWNGSIVKSDFVIPELVTAHGFSLWTPDSPRALQHAKVLGEFFSQGDILSLANTTVELDATSFSGDFFMDAAKSTYRFSVVADTLDLDRYLPSIASAGMEKNIELDFSWAKGLDMQGDITLRRVIYKNLAFDDVSADVSVAEERVAVEPFSATLYKGKVAGSFLGVVDDGINSSLKISLQGMQLEPAALRFTGNDCLGGVASAEFDLHGIVQSTNDWPRAFSGDWEFFIDDGFYSLRSSGEGADHERTAFSHATAKGELKKGILSTDSLELQSLLVKMAGGGWLDFVQRQIDFLINVTFAEIPTFPVRIHGALANPETQIQGKDVLPRTIEKLGGGVLGVLQKIIITPIDVLQFLGGVILPKSVPEEKND